MEDTLSRLIDVILTGSRMVSAGQRSAMLGGPPRMVVDHLRRSYGTILKLQFDVYKYRPQTIGENKITIDIDVDKLDTDLVELSYFARREHMEVSFNSSVRTSDSNIKLHIPMIDCYGELDGAKVDRIIAASKDFELEAIYIFYSGRSYHIYGIGLMDPDMWRRFMGRILLLNMPDQDPLVDARWVGHRLLAGYGTLRWTRNSQYYESEPKLVVYKNLLIGDRQPDSLMHRNINLVLRSPNRLIYRDVHSGELMSEINCDTED